MTPEFKVDFERGARIGLDEALLCESKTVDQISAIMDDVKAKTGRLLLTRLDGSKCSRATAPSSNSIPFHAPPFLANLTARYSRRRWRSSWPGPPTYGLVVRLRGRWPSPANGIANIRMSASPASGACSNESGISDRLRCHRRGGHGRGARQRRWRPGFQRGDRIADIRRLRRGLRGFADIARSGGVTKCGGTP
jgi:hypothetical protein